MTDRLQVVFVFREKNRELKENVRYVTTCLAARLCMSTGPCGKLDVCVCVCAIVNTCSSFFSHNTFQFSLIYVYV